MPFKISQKFIFILCVANTTFGKAQASTLTYEKALLRNGRINISAVSRGDYAEVRFDKDGDGIIDFWTIVDGDHSLTGTFLNGALREVQVNRRKGKFNISLLYLSDKKHSFKLVRSEIWPQKIFFNQTSLSAFSLADTEIEGGNACPKTPISKSIDPKTWKEFVCKTTEFEKQARVLELLAPSCRTLPSPAKEYVVDSIKGIYSLDFNGFVEDNKVLECLNKNTQTQPLISRYISRIVADLQQPEGFQFECEKYKGIGCGQALYNDASKTATVPAPDASCKSNLKDFNNENFLHEFMHRLAPDSLSDASIKNITNGCIFGRLEELNKVSLKVEGDIKEFNPIGKSAVTNETIKHVSEEMPPADAKALSISPTGLLANANVIGSPLNSGFVTTATAAQANFNPNQAFRESRARTDGSFSMFRAAIDKFVPPAHAEASVWNASDYGSIPSANLKASNVSTTSKSGPRASREIASASGASKVGATDVTQSAGKSANVDLSITSQASQENEAQDKKRATLSPQQKQQAVQLVSTINNAKSSNEVLAMLQKNDSRLATLKIHVYDAKASTGRQPAGQKASARKDHYGASQDDAAEFYSLINGKLVPE